MAYLRSGIDGGRPSSSLVRNRVVDIRGDLATGGKLLLTTTEPTVVDGNELGRIDFQAPLDTGGTDAILVAASIYAEADDTFASDNNATELVFATGASETAAEKMRITSDGKVGIGVATPASLLHVAGTVQVGVDGTGHDVKFFGDTASSFWEWDESADTMNIVGDASINGAAIFNEAGADKDFRIESSGDANMFFLDGAGPRIYIKYNASVNIGGASRTIAMHHTTADNTNGIAIMHWGGANSTRGNISIGKSLGTSIGSYTAVTDGRPLGAIEWYGADGDTFELGAQIQAEAAETFSDSARGSEMTFHTVDNTTTTLDERMRIAHNGNVGIGTTAPDDLLHIFKGDASAAAHSDSQVVIEHSGDNALQFLTSATTGSAIYFGDPAHTNDGGIIYQQGSRYMSFRTADGERMRIDSSGKVGIGTTTIGERLTVPHASRIKWNSHGGASGARSVAMGNGYQGSTAQDNFWSIAMSNADDNTIDTALMTVQNNTDIQWHNANASAGSPFTLNGATDNAKHLAFSQSGRTNAIDNFYSGNSSDSTMRLQVSSGNVNGASNFALKCFGDGQVHGRGGITESQSDKRLKTDVTNITTPLSKISAINGVNFKWINNLDDIKPDSGQAGKTDVGVIAQEIEAVLPDAVSLAPFDRGNANKDGSIPEDAVTYKGAISESGENYLTVQYTKIIPLLIEGIKELSAKNTALETKVTALENA